MRRKLTSALSICLTLLIGCSGDPVSRNTIQTVTLDLQTGVVMKSGDVRPVAREDVFLLSQDAFSLLSDAGFKDDKGKPITGGAIILAHAEAELDQFLDPKKIPQFVKMIETLKSKAVGTATTDFSGKAQFSNVTVGDYWLFGFAEVGKSSLVWNLKTTVKAGSNSVVLDQKNAATAF